MIKYILGLILNIFNNRISLWSLVDYKSKISKKAKIYRKTKIFNSQVGDYTYIAPNTSIVCVNIGKFCSISEHCSIGLATHSLKNVSTSPIFTSSNNALKKEWVNKNIFEEYSKTVIGNDVWIGTRVIIMGGVKIGNGAVIGAGSIVTKNVPDYAIVVGVPARIIKYRFEENILNELNKIEWWNNTEDTLKTNINIFQKENINLNDLHKLGHFNKAQS